MTAPVSPDRVGAVRAEDAFDVAAVHGWLREHAPDAVPTDGPADGPPEVRQFAGGASNLTYLLRYPGRDLVLRRPPAGQKARGAHDMAREHRVQARLRPVYPYPPAMVALCQDEAVLGSDFYVMERLEGTILRRDLPEGWDLDPDQVRAMCTGMLDRLVDLHQVDIDAAGLGDLGKGEGYVGRQVAGWSQRYRAARTDDVGDFEGVMSWLDEHQPADVGTCVIHNDWRFDNVVLDEDLAVRGVLDWEMATLGDPLMDLGGALAYWVQADDDRFLQEFRRQPTQVPGMLTRTEVVEHYCARTGLDVGPEQWRFYEVFGLFRLAVIAQQIYYRLYHGQTTNEQYRIFHPAVRYLEDRCRRITG